MSWWNISTEYSVQQQHSVQGLWWVAACFWMLLIYYFSSQTALGGFGILGLFPHADKLVHAATYGILALMLYAALGRPLTAWLLASLYGISDEIHQSFVPGRSADVWDVLANSTGAALAILFVRYLWRRWHSRKIQ